MQPFSVLGLITAFLVLSSLGAVAQSNAAEDSAVTGLEIGTLECPGRKKAGKWQSKSCQIGDHVRATVSGLSDWRDGETGKLQHLVLSVNGHQLKDVTPAYYSLKSPDAAPQNESGNENAPADGARTYYLSFLLSRTDENRDNWLAVLKRYNPFGKTSVILEVADKNPGKTYGGISVELKVASNFRIRTAAFIFLVVFLGLVWGASQGHFLREVGPKASNKPKNSFSLASTQMALWFVIIFGSFIYLWMVTGDIDTLTPGVLVLAGISVGTGLVATAITANNQNTRAALAAEQAKLTDDVKNLEMRPAEADPEIAAKHAAEIKKMSDRLEVVSADLKKLPAKPKLDSKANFFTDLLMTEGEVTLSRLQIIGWTLILAVVFLHSVFADLTMPEFSATLLGLMGISGSTYVGFKFPKPLVEGA